MSYKNKDWLENQYLVLKKSTVQIAKECNVNSAGTIYYWVKKLSIKVRNPSESHKGKKLSEVHIRKISEAMKGENHPKWKGDMAKEITKCDRIHNIVRRLKPKPECCEDCGKKTSELDLSFNNFHKDKNPIYYTENPNDYTYRCAKCHKKYDKRIVPNQSITLERFLSVFYIG